MNVELVASLEDVTGNFPWSMVRMDGRVWFVGLAIPLVVTR
jgi:hypothetical protein